MPRFLPRLFPGCPIPKATSIGCSPLRTLPLPVGIAAPTGPSPGCRHSLLINDLLQRAHAKRRAAQVIDLCIKGFGGRPGARGKGFLIGRRGLGSCQVATSLLRRPPRTSPCCHQQSGPAPLSLAPGAHLAAVFLVALVLWLEALLVLDELVLHKEVVFDALELQQPQLAARRGRDRRQLGAERRGGVALPLLLADARRRRGRLPLLLLLRSRGTSGAGASGGPPWGACGLAAGCAWSPGASQCSGQATCGWGHAVGAAPAPPCHTWSPFFLSGPPCPPGADWFCPMLPTGAYPRLP
jgi:hypothetical protein